MGIRKASAAPTVPAIGMADVLFTPVQQRVLGLLFGQPQRRFQSAELIRLAAAGTGAVHRFVTRLAGAGLVDVETVGNQKFYRANGRSPIFAELAGLARKTVGLVEPLRAALEPLADDIDVAFVYGSIAKGTEKASSDIDLMVVSDRLDHADLYRLLPAVEASLSRTVNPNLMTRAEWQRKRAQKDSFAARIATQPKLFVVGSSDDLG